ncbi:hypothetical protein [Odoribacter laneus]|uniref:Uncharacterized protein n=1 Tax=Odoribacter laneus YIT 12061 TaxID=742817 RepID=H1DJ59_9BACT|nr:hypothetical protein [Odoribacter laneus]EHP46821.1 hypothetical protein HMPREF9449_02438 [Odoribacter laneus YIT 12061]
MFWSKKIGVYLICLGSALLITIQGKGEKRLANESLPEGFLRITEREYIPEVCRFMFRDHEPPEVMFDEKERSFYVNEPLQVRLTRKKELLLRFYSPRSIQNVTIWAYLQEGGERVRLMEFEVIWPFLEFRRLLPFGNKDYKYYTAAGKAVLLNPKTKIGELKLEIECKDPLYVQMTSSPCHWKIAFGAYCGENWSPLLPAHAREAVAISLNLSSLFASQEFLQEIDRYRGKLYLDNSKTVINIDELFTQIFSLKMLRYVHVIGRNGVGGNNIMGLNEWCYLEHYPDDECKAHTIFHEFAHCMGYNHSGNMTYVNGLGKGWVALCSELYAQLCIDQKLPVYSRHFLCTRQCNNRYGGDLYVQKKTKRKK